MADSNRNDWEDIHAAVLKYVRSRGWENRIACIDLETKILAKNEFLTGERILAAGMSWMEGGEIRTWTKMLAEETDKAEMDLLSALGVQFHVVRPLVLVGYNIAGYDYPLLCMKQKWWGENIEEKLPDGRKKFPVEYWALKDGLTRSWILDIMHPARFHLSRKTGGPAKHLPLSDVLGSEHFAETPFLRLKHLTNGQTSEDKGKIIYGMWQRNDPDLTRYLEGDVHDTLLLMKEIYKDVFKEETENERKDEESGKE